jgi:intracellular septation protein A
MKEIMQKTGLAGIGTSILFAASFALAGIASATPADPVADAFDTLQDKVTTYGTAVVALVVAVVVLFFGIKFLKRGASKA